MTDLADWAAVDEPAAMATCQVPDHYRAPVVLAADQGVFAGIPSNERDLHKTLHVTDVPTPLPAPGEVLIAVMASSINYNTVWTAMFEPVSTLLIINRSAFESWDPRGQPRRGNWSRFRNTVRDLADGDPEIVFEHPGRETFGVSVLTAARGGTIVTCASTSGYEHLYDNRHLWMRVKRIIGTHSANYRETWKANELVIHGRIHPIMSRVYPLDGIADAACAVRANEHHGKVGVLCLAPRESLGIRDKSKRERHLDQITLFQRTAIGEGLST